MANNLLKSAKLETIKSLIPYAAFALAGLFAGALNAVAGGGTLISFPTMLAFGIPAVPANATNAVALWPGSLAGVWGYRAEAKGASRLIAALTLPAILGALFGAWALINTPEKLFRRAVPALLLLATTLFWLQPRFKKFVEKSAQRGKHPLVAFLLQCLISIYGGYFGAGMGIIMLAVLGLFIEGNIHRLNAIKTWLATVINIVASIFFLTSNAILIWPGVAVGIGAIAGGYWGARLSTRVDQNLIRRFIIAVGFILTAVFAWKL